MQTPNDPSATILPEKLAAALSCLDVTLEDELALYRNQKNAHFLALSVSEPPPVTLSESGDGMEEDEEALLPRLLGQELDYQEPEVVYAELETEPLSEAESLQVEPLIAQDRLATESYSVSTANSDDRLGSVSEVDVPISAELEEMKPTPLQDSTEPIIQEKPSSSAETPETSDKLPTPYGVEGNPLPESFDGFLDPSIDDYLESSEGLLKHMDTNSVTDTEKRVQQSTQTSWKIAIALGVGFGVILSGIMLLTNYLKPAARAPESPTSSPTSSLTDTPQPSPVSSPTTGTVPSPVNSGIQSPAFSPTAAPTVVPQQPGGSPASNVPAATTPPVIPSGNVSPATGNTEP